jgi:RNA polymerase sigma-70 factor (ECF subfamily)
VQRDLVQAAQGGDHEAFEALVVGVADRLYAVARLILRDTDRAQDAVQETLVRSWRELPSLRDPDRFGAWLHRLLVNACADQGRRQRRWSAQVRVLHVEPHMDDGTRSVADRDQLERGFRRLKPELRTVVVLHHYLDLPASEIAEIMGTPEGTVRSRLHYAMEALRAALDADERATGLPDGRTA